METFEDIRKCWQQNMAKDANTGLLSKESIEGTIRARVRKQQAIVLQYFWPSFTYQVLIYAFASHLLIKFWGDGQVMLFSLCGAILYIPFTAILLNRFKAMYASATDKSFPVQNIGDHVKKQHALLLQFFRFKKRFEWLAIPLSCLIMVMIVFKLYVPGGIAEYPASGIIFFVMLLTCFATAIYFENRKHFAAPLRKLESILKDIDKDPENR